MTYSENQAAAFALLEHAKRSLLEKRFQDCRALCKIAQTKASAARDAALLLEVALVREQLGEIVRVQPGEEPAALDDFNVALKIRKTYLQLRDESILRIHHSLYRTYLRLGDYDNAKYHQCQELGHKYPPKKIEPNYPLPRNNWGRKKNCRIGWSLPTRWIYLT